MNGERDLYARLIKLLKEQIHVKIREGGRHYGIQFEDSCDLQCDDEGFKCSDEVPKIEEV
jgi:hypothetical protein